MVVTILKHCSLIVLLKTTIFILMKLFYSHTSPYARKVRLIALEKGLADQVETILVDTSAENPELFAANPLGKIPTLMLNNSEALFDSPVICRYLDSISEPSLYPDNSWQLWAALRWEALADGLLDAAYNLVMESRRPEGEKSPSNMTRWTTEIERTLRHINANLAQLGEEIIIAQLALGAAIGYVDFRLSSLLRTGEYPQLTTWYESFQQRPSMQTTRPQ